MKLLFRTYLASLREREELDAILPDLLSELGYTVYSRPQRGTTQSGVDVAAVGKDDDGERKLFLFSVKQGDLTRQSWDGTPQALRSSLNEILDTYIPTKIPKRYQKLKIVICLVFGGDMQEQPGASLMSLEDGPVTRLRGYRIAGPRAVSRLTPFLPLLTGQTSSDTQSPSAAMRLLGREVHSESRRVVKK